MIIKLFIDDTFPFCVVKTAVTVNWIVEEHKPLGHPDHIQSLMQAIGLPRRDAAGLPFAGVWVHVSGRIIDLNKTAADNHLVGNTVLAVSVNKPMSANTPRSARSGTRGPASGGENDDDDVDSNDSSSEQGDNNNNASNPATPRDRALSRKSSNRSLGSSDGEVYTAPECGWFPFVVSSGRIVANFNQPPPSRRNQTSGSDSEAADGDNSAAPSPTNNAAAAAAQQQAPRERAPFTPRDVTSVRCINAHEEPDPEDPEPKTVDLCPPCQQIVAKCIQTTNADTVTHVDRHYRPMMVDTETIPVWLFKLGGGRFARYQKRWFMITEKSIDWYETPPAVDQRDKVKGSRMINVEGKFVITRIVDNPTKEEFPKVEKSGAGKYYFVLFFEGAPQPTHYYAESEADRGTVCGFLQKLKKRSEQQGGNTRDPVFWKQWANSLLVSTSNMAETRHQKQEELRVIEEECKELQRQIDGLKAGRGDTQAQLVYNRGLVDRLEKEAVAAHRRNAELDRSAAAIRESVEVRRHELSHSLGQSEDLTHRTRIIEQESLAEKKRVILQLAELKEENERLQHKIDALFAKWRRVEEHHVEAAFRPSTLSPADIAARAARDYERRSGVITGNTSSRGGVGPMAPLTHETFTPRKRGAAEQYAMSPDALAATHSSSGGYVANDTPRRTGDAAAGTPDSQRGNNNNIAGSTLSSPNARLHGAVRETLESGGSAMRRPELPQGQTLKQAAKTGRITFGLSAALGYVPGSPDALSTSRGARRL